MHLISQLLGQSPVILVALTGVVLALVHWRKYSTPCLLTLVASGLLLLATFLQPLSIDVITRVDISRRYMLLAAFGLFFNVLRALSFGLLLAGVFSRRKTTPVSP